MSQENVEFVEEKLDYIPPKNPYNKNNNELAIQNDNMISEGVVAVNIANTKMTLPPQAFKDVKFTQDLILKIVDEKQKLNIEEVQHQHKLAERKEEEKERNTQHQRDKEINEQKYDFLNTRLKDTLVYVSYFFSLF